MSKKTYCLLFFLFFLFPFSGTKVFASYSYSPMHHLLYPEDWLEITYCLEETGAGCKKSVSSLEEFLTLLPTTGNWSYAPSDFKAENGLISFSNGNFKYYIPVYVFEDKIAHARYNGDLNLGSFFTISSWMKLDEDRNLIPDDIDDITGVFDEVYKNYFSDSSEYKFKPAWKGQLPIQLDYVCSATIDESGCALGGYSPDGYISMDLTDPFNTNIDTGIDYKNIFELKATIAHEIFHAIQYYYIGESMGEKDKYDNFIEGMAVLMQKYIAEWGDQDYLNYLESSPLLRPEKSVFGPTIRGEMSNYGSYVWYNFLHQKYGKTIVKDLLEQYAAASSTDTVYRSFIATDEALKKHNTSIADAYLEYVTWNYDYGKYTDGKHFRPTYISEKHTKFPVVLTQISTDEAPHLYASNYIEFKLGDDNKNLEVSFAGNLDADMYLTFLSSKKGKVDYKSVVNHPVGKGETYNFTIPSYGSDTVVMIASVLDVNVQQQTDNIFSDYVYPYSYSAKKIDPIEFDKNASIGKINLKDYFIFDSGKTWKYKSVYKVGDKVENGELSTKTIECTLRDDCITYDYGKTGKRSFFLSGKNIYGIGEKDEDITQVKFLTVDSFSSVLDAKQYEFFGYKKGEDGVSQISIACTPSLVEDYSFNGNDYPTVINDCTLQTVSNLGGKMQSKSKEYYAKGIGLVKYSEASYYDDKMQYSYEESLIDTNVIDLVGSVSTDETVNPFSDLSDDNKNKTAILYLRDKGVINGYVDGTFKPDATVTRAELLKILIEGKGVHPTYGDYNGCFKDSGNDWYTPYACYAKSMNWVGGYTDGTFRPNQAVNKVEALKILLNSQDIATAPVTDKPFDDIPADDWSAQFVAKAKELGLLEETDGLFAGLDGKTRAGICENLYRLLIK